jgi:hypothetical protein
MSSGYGLSISNTDSQLSPRLGLIIIIYVNKLSSQSYVQYCGMCIDADQLLATLVGPKSKLILRHESNIAELAP